MKNFIFDDSSNIISLEFECRHRERESKRNENKNVLKALKGETLMLVNNFFSFFSFLTVGGKTFIVVCLMMSCSNKKRREKYLSAANGKTGNLNFSSFIVN